MELTVRVMMAGREIDRITRAHKILDGDFFVWYRRREWLVEEGCIHVDALPEVPAALENPALLADLRPFLDLIDKPLTVGLTDCTALLRSRFPEVPDATVISIATLTQLGLKLVAKEVLMDFLELQNQCRSHAELGPFASEHVFTEAEGASPFESADINFTERPDTIEGEGDWSLDWQPEQGWNATEIDDTELRNLATKTQKLIGSHVALETGHRIESLGELPDSDDWRIIVPTSGDMEVLTDAAPESRLPLGDNPAPRATMPAVAATSSMLPSPHLAFIVEKTAALGEAALEVLRYFADNPDDKSSHAEQFTGIPRGMINALLTGTLSRYVEKTNSGGWACHTWVQDVLAVMDGNLE
ncbi:hypothetical protein PMI38_00673 [Pseudomonas sp. GM84]|jgi:hypothetical protein|uniref:hypothetical protein n=1 Tax=Pseudomonas sp. GM84 TaxID=1144340 RepID=UPI00026FAD21|nr:hypothetical protein [Pseudomonas sp. GM84]EJN39826.1 hypothetical protein PMI38_00673 [Pseudomonas sp. GM84]